MKLKKKWFILLFSFLILLSFLLIGMGVYFNHLATPQYIMNESLNRIHSKIEDIWNSYSDYDVGDNFTINGSINMMLDSEKLAKEKDFNPDSLKSYQTIRNLSNMQSDFIIMQDKKQEKAFLSLSQKLGDENFLNAKYVIDDATKYYFVNRVLENYVNYGNCSYFESLTSENTTVGNIEYLYSFLMESFQNNLSDDYFETYQVDQIIDGNQKKVHQVSLKLTDKTIHMVLKDILNDLKSDERANTILTGLNEKFSSAKVRDKDIFLKSQESYTINIYTTTFVYRPLKYEIIHLNGNEKEVFSYEGDTKEGKFYYVQNDSLVYRIDAVFQDKSLNFKYYDSTEKEIGALQAEFDHTGFYVDYDYSLSNKKYHFSCSSKYQNLKKGKFYQNDTDISIKITEDKLSVINGDITIHTDVKNEVKIVEDISDAVLSSTLTEEENHHFDTLYDSLLERLER